MVLRDVLSSAADENGFKCHQTSEPRTQQMRIFAENPALDV